jgi:hypothetical protein
MDEVSGKHRPPGGGRADVRRFKCLNSRCPAVTLAEQVPGLTSPHARYTPLLRAVLSSRSERESGLPSWVTPAPGCTSTSPCSLSRAATPPSQEWHLGDLARLDALGLNPDLPHDG